MTNEALEHNLNLALKQLPSPPALILKLLKMIDEPDSNIDSLATLIGQDTALGAAILRIANSPFYRPRNQILSLRDACVMLGIHALRNLITVGGMMRYFPTNNTKISAIWRHASGTAIGAKYLAEDVNLDADAAFTSGLLHDLGRLAIYSYMTEQLDKIEAYKLAKACTTEEAEIEILGYTHAHLGKRIAELWRLPSVIINTIEYHHHPEQVSCQPLVDVVHVADILNYQISSGNHSTEPIATVSPEIYARLRLTESMLDKCRANMEKHQSSLLACLNDG